MTNKIFAGPAGAEPILTEALTVAAFLPGTLLEQPAAGFSATNNASTTFGNAFIVAKEQATTLGGGINTLTVVGDTTEAILPKTGEYVYLRMAVANLTAKSVALASNGNGQFKIAALGGTEQVFAYTEEIINVTVAGTLVLCRAAQELNKCLINLV